jgi:hypothetical protein
MPLEARVSEQQEDKVNRVRRTSRVTHLVLAFACAASFAATAGAAEKLSRLKVSDNKRFLVTEDGKPFFYLGDTAWELFHRLNREEADRYLKDRAAKGFTVIQAVAIAELEGHTDPNPYGQRLLGPRRLHRRPGERQWPVRRLPADLGPLLARHEGRPQAAVHG